MGEREGKRYMEEGRKCGGKREEEERERGQKEITEIVSSGDSLSPWVAVQEGPAKYRRG